MKSTRIIAITLTAIMAVTAFSGCANNANKNSPSYVENNRKVTPVATTNSSDERISTSEAETTSISVTSTKANTCPAFRPVGGGQLYVAVPWRDFP